MKSSIIAVLAFVLVGSIIIDVPGAPPIGHRINDIGDGTMLHVLDVPEYDVEELRDAVLTHDVVVLSGNITDHMPRVYNSSLTLTGETDFSTSNLLNGIWVKENSEHTLSVKGYSTSTTVNGNIHDWIHDLMFDYNPPSGLFSSTEVEFHEPYGVLKTKTELLKVDDSSSSYDWYDVTVTQTLTPGVNFTDSDWEWEWITYTMNGSRGDSTVFLSDYDSPPTNELPTGLFSFLWRILNFHPRDFFPWFYPSEPEVEGMDMSDFSQEKYTVRYQAPAGYKGASEPVEVRHHYVLRVNDGVKPRFWQQSQVKYVRGSVLASPPYYSQLLHEGYLELR